MTRRSSFWTDVLAIAPVSLLIACQPSTPKQSAQREAAADVAAADAATITAAKVQPHTYGTAEYMVMTKSAKTAPLVMTETPKMVVGGDVAMKAIKPTSTVHRAEIDQAAKIKPGRPYP